MISRISGWNVYIIDIEFFLSGEVHLDILDFGISRVDCSWDFIVGKNYVAFNVGDESSPVGVGSVSSYWSEVWNVGGLSAGL